ncbi:ATP-binding cassette domain-containing protein [Corynebacterium auriscanis]|uniref:ATP-binding cassette domain-containing protein n=1 Tax=Corynebacterium auriscanis TaxID=99807 RepID=UPI003CF8B29C
MPITDSIWAESGTGLSEHAWNRAEAAGAAWVGNEASAHISLLRSTVIEELAVGMEQRGVPRDVMQSRIAEALHTWGLQDHAEHHPSRLSTGQTRRLAIAAALLSGADSLVLDCPLDGFDTAAVETLRRTLATFPGEVTVYDRGRSILSDAATRQLHLTSTGDLDELAAPGPVLPDAGRGRLGYQAQEGARELRGGEHSGTPKHTTTPKHAATPKHTTTPERTATPKRATEFGQDVQQGSSAELGYAATPERTAVLNARGVRIPRGVGEVGPIDVTAFAGDVTHLEGPNGCGKTSLFLAVLGLVPFTGQIDRPEGMPGWAPTAMDTALARRTVLDELAYGVDRESAEAVLEFAGLQQWADTHPLDVPSSWRRIVLVAAAMVRAPKLVLLDEPTVGLDWQGYGHLAELMHRYADGEYHRLRGVECASDTPQPAVMWTCHDRDFALAVSDARIRWRV